MTKQMKTIVSRMNALQVGETWNRKGTKVQFRGSSFNETKNMETRKYHVETFTGERFEYIDLQDAYDTVLDSHLDWEIENDC